MAPALSYTSLPSAISSTASAATSSDYSFIFIIVALIALFLGLGCYAYRAAHREQGEVLEVTSEQCALHFIATKGQDILSNLYEHIPNGLLGKPFTQDEEKETATIGRARANSTFVAPTSPTTSMLDKCNHRKSRSLPGTKFDAQKEAALTKIALLGEARRIDVLSTASDKTIKALLASPGASEACSEMATGSKLGPQAVGDNSKLAMPNELSNISSTPLSTQPVHIELSDTYGLTECSKEQNDNNHDKIIEVKDSFNINIADPERKLNVGLGLLDIHKVIADSENLSAVDLSYSNEEHVISSMVASSALEAAPAVTDSSVLFSHILEDTPDWLLGNGLDSSWTIEAIDDLSSSDEDETTPSLGGDFPPTPPQEQHHQAPPTGGLLCSLPCIDDLASVADSVGYLENATSDSFFATLKQDEADLDLKTNLENETLFLSSLACSSDLASIAECLYEISDLDRKDISPSERKQQDLEDGNDEMDVANMSFVLESISELALSANVADVPVLKLNGVSTSADVLEASYQDMQFNDSSGPLSRTLLNENWEPLGPAICITANVKARGLDKRENDIYFGEATLRVLIVKVHASYTREQFYEAVSKEVGSDIEIEGGIVIDEIEDYVSLRIPGFYPDWIQSCVDAGGVGEIECWRPRPQYFTYF